MRWVVFGGLMFAVSAGAAVKSLGLNFTAPAVDGKTNVYLPNIGDIVYDSSDSTFWGRADTLGVGFWTQLSGSSSSSNPAGTVITFAGATCPAGYLPADGKSYSQSANSALYAALASAHGDGSTGATGDVGCPAGSGCFNVPDYRGRFLRGVDGTAGRDPNDSVRAASATGGNTGDSVGSIQDDAFQGHVHNFPGQFGYGTVGSFPAGSNTNNATYNVSGPISDGVNGTPRTSSETRSKNAYVNFCVKT